MFCKGCGKLIDSAKKRCPHCGRDVDALSGGTGFWDLVVENEEVTGRIPKEQRAPERASDTGEPTVKISSAPIVADNLNGLEATIPARSLPSIDAVDDGKSPSAMTRNQDELRTDPNSREHLRESDDWAENAAPRNFDTQRRASPVLLAGIAVAVLAIVLAVVAFALPRCSGPADPGGNRASESAAAVSNGEPKSDDGQSSEVASDAAAGTYSGRTEDAKSAGIGLEGSRDGGEPGRYPGSDSINATDRNANQDAPGLNNAGDSWVVICKPQNLDGGPYLVKAIHVQKGKQVVVGDDLFTISKDKDEETIRAEHAGVVSEILVEVGENVDVGDKLAQIESGVNRSQVFGNGNSGNSNEAAGASTTISTEESADGSAPDSSPVNTQETVGNQNQNGLGESTSYGDGSYNNGEGGSEDGDGGYDDSADYNYNPDGSLNDDYDSEADYQ